MKRKPPKPELEHLGIKIGPDLHQYVKDEAAARMLDKSDIVREAIREHQTKRGAKR